MLQAAGILFCNFTGVYDKEGILSLGDVLDLRSLSGTGMYVDKEAERAIRDKLDVLDGLCRYKIRFLDNGNYHYMTRIFASYVQEPFDLITFDHHTDDQPPSFGGLKSCGSWRLDIRSENRMLKGSMLVQDRDGFERDYIPSDMPLYISLDKDILSEEVLKTNWDQGDMRGEELFDILKMLYDTRDVIALDVCGEDLPDAPCGENREFNEMLIGLLPEIRETGRS